METQQLGGAINPFALTETLIGKRIDWSKLQDPLALVEKTLETPADRLFDGGKGSPLFFAPRAAGRGAASKPARKMAGKAKNAGTRALPLKTETLARTISPALAARLQELLTPMLPPALRTTEYPGATWKDPGDFFEEGTEFADPVQGAVGDCWLIAALASVALCRPYAIAQRNRTTGADNQAFVDAVDFSDTPSTTKRFEVTENLPVNDASGVARFARSAESGEIWPGIYEKAFAKFRSGNLTDKPDILTLGGGDCVDASAKLVPGTSAHYTNTNGTSADDLWTQLRQNCIATPGNGPFPVFWGTRCGRTINPMTAWTYAKASDAPDDIAYDSSTGIVGWHCYSILGWITRSARILTGSKSSRARIEQERYIVLRNPWGQYEGRVDTLAGHWDDQEISWTRSTPLNSRGVFAMKIETFKRYYAGMGVAR